VPIFVELLPHIQLRSQTPLQDHHLVEERLVASDFFTQTASNTPNIMKRDRDCTESTVHSNNNIDAISRSLNLQQIKSRLTSGGTGNERGGILSCLQTHLSGLILSPSTRAPDSARSLLDNNDYGVGNIIELADNNTVMIKLSEVTDNYLESLTQFALSENVDDNIFHQMLNENTHLGGGPVSENDLVSGTTADLFNTSTTATGDNYSSVHSNHEKAVHDCSHAVTSGKSFNFRTSISTSTWFDFDLLDNLSAAECREKRLNTIASRSNLRFIRKTLHQTNVLGLTRSTFRLIFSDARRKVTALSALNMHQRNFRSETACQIRTFLSHGENVVQESHYRSEKLGVKRL